MENGKLLWVVQLAGAGSSLLMGLYVFLWALFFRKADPRKRRKDHFFVVSLILVPSGWGLWSTYDLAEKVIAPDSMTAEFIYTVFISFFWIVLCGMGFAYMTESRQSIPK
jgi:hypothetical protein